MKLPTPSYGRIQSFDERSRNFPVRALFGASQYQPRSYTWRCLPALNQGREGACVGFAWAHELAARPAEVPNITNGTAMNIYRQARFLDEFKGENYSGTSVLAGVKAVQLLHVDKIVEYRWAFSFADVLMVLSYFGPVVLGLYWYRGMETPHPVTGIIRPTGGIVGGHAILATGINVEKKLVRLHNSWGAGWGLGGDAFISFTDLDFLLRKQGEACIATVRAPERRAWVPKAVAFVVPDNTVADAQVVDPGVAPVPVLEDNPVDSILPVTPDPDDSMDPILAIVDLDGAEPTGAELPGDITVSGPGGEVSPPC